jgi:hypothetical protein
VTLVYFVRPGEGWARLEHALSTAGVLLLVTMAIGKYVARFAGRDAAASIKVFAAVWAVVIVGWVIVFAR